MYHCQLQIYLAGHGSEALGILKRLPPSPGFSHSFTESREPDPSLAADAGLILADVQGQDALAAVQALLRAKAPEAECIVIASREQAGLLEEVLDGLADLWTGPLSGAELRFRFQRWQRERKLRADAWETHQFLEATINSVPNLIWYKDKNGIHEKVNDSFCRTVNKTKQQVQGRGHAYIWDVEHDDPACIESEREVMQNRRTFVSEETVQTGEGTRLLTTYKSPLYDLDGSVMGTVGVAIDVTQERAYEQEIVHKNNTLEMLFTTMDCGVMTHSTDGSRILSINRAALRILGYESMEEMLIDGFDMVADSVVDEDKQQLRECITSLKKVGDNVSTEYRVRHPDGSELHVMGNVKLLEENGELFYQRFLLDCTEQKLQEKRERAESERRQSELVHALSIDYSLACFFDIDTGLGSGWTRAATGCLRRRLPMGAPSMRG